MPPIRDHTVSYDHYPAWARPVRDRKARNWMLVFNNWTPEIIEILISLSCIWIIFAEEIAPTTGTPHLQGYVMFKSQIHWTALCRLVPGCWFKPADGNPHSNYLYVTKTRPERVDKDTGETLPADPVPNPPEKIHESGTRPCFTKQKDANRRNSQRGGDATRENWELAREAARAGDWDAIPANILIQHLGNLQRLYAMERAKVLPMENVELRDWQQELKGYLEGPVDNRKIYWYWCEPGNSGKSFMATYISRNMGGLVVENGKTADIAHVLDQPKIVVFDFARCTDSDKINYSVMECIKNGRIFSPKYQSICKSFDPPHLVVFANFPCPHGKFSADRLDETDLVRWRPTVPAPTEPSTSEPSPIPPRPTLRRSASVELPSASLAPGFNLPQRPPTPAGNPPVDPDWMEMEGELRGLQTSFDFSFLE